MSEIANSPHIRTEDLLPALTACLTRLFGKPCAIESLDRRASEYRSSYALEVLDVGLSDGRSLEVMLKDLSPSSISDEARRAKPVFLYDPLREIEVYRHILSPRVLGTPVCYGAVIDPAEQRYWLLLEKVPATELYMVGELETWEQVARWLARLHVAGASVLNVLDPHVRARLVHYDADYYRRWICRAAEFADLKWLPSAADVLGDRLVALGATFIHGEFYASNILVETTGVRPRVCPVDWELAGVGPGLLDLAALVAGNWPESSRAALATAYHEEVSRLSRTSTDSEKLRQDLAWCRLYVAIQWLGWSQQWTPPASQAHDWRGEAIGLAEQLGLS